MTHTRDTILALLKDRKPSLLQRFPINRIALFGSFARNDATSASDIDIMVDVNPSIGLEFVTLADELEELLGQQVDLVSFRAIRPPLWKFIEPDLIDV